MTWWREAAIGVLVLLLATQTYRIDRLHRDLADAQARTVIARAETKASEATRAREAGTSKDAFESLRQTCDAGLKLAVQRGRTIEHIVSTPARPDGSRGLVGALQLRDVVGQGTGPARP